MVGRLGRPRPAFLLDDKPNLRSDPGRLVRPVKEVEG
jgi:hypothetical protein